MVYSPSQQPEVNESHIHEVHKNYGLIFHTGEVSELYMWRKTETKMFFFIVLKVKASVPEPDIEKENIQARFPEYNSHVFNLSICSVTFKM